MGVRRGVIRSVAALGALLVVALASGCMAVRGSGHVVGEERDIASFDAVEVSGSGILRVTQGPDEKLTVHADDNLMQYIQTEARGGTLRIGIDPKAVGFFPSRPIEYDLVVNDLTSVSLSGSCDLEAGHLTVSTLDVRVSGSGDVTMADLDAANLSYTLSGSGKAVVTGVATRQHISISGSGQYDAGELRSDVSEIEVSGSGRAVLWAETSLDVRISGSGDVKYYGAPQVTQNVAGSGAVSSLGRK